MPSENNGNRNPEHTSGKHPSGEYPSGKQQSGENPSGKQQKSRKPNRLIDESSPYLRQHAWNPVDWYPWGEEALERARRENRMIFLSIGYSSCHWCHVMERESFEDAHSARLLNKHFVNIKVDREERPDVDAVYMEALQMMTGQGGWPLNVWLTPDQVPIFAGTYFPPQDMHGRPGFPSVVTRLAQVWKEQPDRVRKQADEMRKALTSDIYDHLDPTRIREEHLQRAYQGYAQSFDGTDGGFSGAPKFPAAMGIGFLLRYGHQPGAASEKSAHDAHHDKRHNAQHDAHHDKRRDNQHDTHHEKSRASQHGAHHMALFSLEKMISGGIYDQVGGGFHRYSTDDQWLVPHFEKMLYDNALLLMVLAEAAQLTGRELFRRTVDETISFLNREMRHPDGAYYSALDADTEGEEGKFYTFTHEELKEQLDDASFALVSQHYGVKPGGNWEGASVLHRAVPLEELARKSGSDPAELQRQLDAARQQLLTYRNRRERPGLDDKIITSWNALLLIALCSCSRMLGRDPDEAVSLGTFLAEKAVQDDTLYRIIDRDGKVKQPGFLDDYALLADGFSHLFEITGEMRWLSLSMSLTEKMIGRFHDKEKTAFRYHPSDGEQLIAQTRDLFDNAQPGGSTAAITALYRAGLLAGKPEWTRMAVAAMEPLSETAARHPNAFGYLLQTMHRLLYPGREIVIVPGKDHADPAASQFLSAWREHYDPNSLIITLPAAADPKNAGYPEPYADKTARNGKSTAYICESFQCRSPVQTLDDFRKELAT